MSISPRIREAVSRVRLPEVEDKDGIERLMRFVDDLAIGDTVSSHGYSRQ